MKPHKSTTSISAAILAFVATTLPLHAQKKWDAPPIVTTYCSGCHGVDGNSQLPYFPKLGGLDATYAQKKITAFKEPTSPAVDELYWWTLKAVGIKKDPANVTRDERINMEGVAHAAKPELLKAAAEWYAHQPPSRGHHNGGNKTLIEEGSNLFAKGVPAEKILPSIASTDRMPKAKEWPRAWPVKTPNIWKASSSRSRKGDRSHAPEMQW